MKSQVFDSLLVGGSLSLVRRCSPGNGIAGKGFERPSGPRIRLRRLGNRSKAEGSLFEGIIGSNAPVSSSRDSSSICGNLGSALDISSGRRGGLVGGMKTSRVRLGM